MGDLEKPVMRYSATIAAVLSFSRRYAVPRYLAALLHENGLPGRLLRLDRPSRYAGNEDSRFMLCYLGERPSLSTRPVGGDGGRITGWAASGVDE